MERMTSPPFACRGKAGAPAVVTPRRRTDRRVVCRQGRVRRACGLGDRDGHAGSGGFGPPAERDPAAVGATFSTDM